MPAVNALQSFCGKPQIHLLFMLYQEATTALFSCPASFKAPLAFGLCKVGCMVINILYGGLLCLYCPAKQYRSSLLPRTIRLRVYMYLMLIVSRNILSVQEASEAPLLLLNP